MQDYPTSDSLPRKADVHARRRNKLAWAPQGVGHANNVPMNPDPVTGLAWGSGRGWGSSFPASGSAGVGLEPDSFFTCPPTAG